MRLMTDTDHRLVVARSSALLRDNPKGIMLPSQVRGLAYHHWATGTVAKINWCLYRCLYCYRDVGAKFWDGYAHRCMVHDQWELYCLASAPRAVRDITEGRWEGRLEWIPVTEGITVMPQLADIVILSPSGSGTPEHGGLVVEVDPDPTDGQFKTHEGNYANTTSVRSYHVDRSGKPKHVCGYIRVVSIA